MSLINVKELYKLYRTKDIETQALENVNLDIEKGEFVSIMGPSGCGKSTLLNIIGMLDRPTKGSVEIDGKTIGSMADSQMADFRNHKIGFVFQSFHLIPSLTVADNVELPLTYRKGLSASERKRRVKEVLDAVGLSHRAGHYPSQLSGGQSQRVAIARAIVGDPDIILADEPTGSLDSRNRDDIRSIITDLRARHKQTFLIVTHDPTVADIADRTVMMADGRITEIITRATAQTPLSDPADTAAL